MKKTYILDTNVLIQLPEAIQCFEDNNVVIPLVVLEELDNLKKSEGEKGANARKCIRYLEKYRLAGNLLEGIPMEHGGILRVEGNCVNTVLPDTLPEEKADNRILKVCKKLNEDTGCAILVSKDILLRIKAQILGLTAEDFSTEQVSSKEEQYKGRTECYVPEEFFKDFKKKGIGLEYAYQVDEKGSVFRPEWVENQFVVLHADQSSKKTQLGIVKGEKIISLEYKKAKPYGVVPRNAGQFFLQEALMKSAKEAPLVIVKGIAGTAKTFYSLAVGLEKVLNNPTGEYRRILICRPNSQFDSEIGFLPGDEKEKISPLMRPIIDNLEQLIDTDEKERYKDESQLQDKIEEIMQRGLVQMEALNYIRGRSLIHTYLIIDEAQNMTPNQVKGIITRAGHGTKIILLGDPGQIDKPFLDERTNGLSYASERMKGSKYCFQVTMEESECERSELALDSAIRL